MKKRNSQSVARIATKNQKQGQSLLEKQDFDSLPALDQAVSIAFKEMDNPTGVGYYLNKIKG